VRHPLRTRRAHDHAPLDGAELVARPSRWGSPFEVGPNLSRAEAVALYEDWIGE
jgi:hypothetical protein